MYKTLIAQGETVQIPENILKDIPYLDTLFSGRFVTNNVRDGIVKSEEFNGELLKVIIRYLKEKKKCKLYAYLKPNQDVMELMEMFRYLALKPPIDTSLCAVTCLLHEPPSFNVMSQGDVLNYAFAIFYAKGQINWKKKRDVRNGVYKTVQYVFKSKDLGATPRAKFHLKRLALNCVTFSYNQYQRLKQLCVPESIDDSDTEDILTGCFCGTCNTYDDSDDTDGDCDYMEHDLFFFSSSSDYYDSDNMYHDDYIFY